MQAYPQEKTINRIEFKALIIMGAFFRNRISHIVGIE